MGSPKKKSIFKLAIKRFLNPFQLAKILRLQRNRKKGKRVYDDAQLKLYHRILPGDYLHYGYFDDPSVQPLDISINMIYRAQDRYAEKLVDLIQAPNDPILDIGCGMGGMLGLMNRRGMKATGLTPDKNQAKHIREKYPNTLLESRFEDLEGQAYLGHFGTVITSESLQYLQTDIALPLIQTILKPGGVWVACDYFRIGEAVEKSGHNWLEFTEALAKHGFRITHEEDITPHILPTIAYVHHWAAHIGLPVKEFALEKLRTKAPGIHYGIEPALPVIEEKLQKNIQTVDPALFSATKKYVLMRIERA